MGWYAQRFPGDVTEIAISTVWAGAIGFGLGSTFEERRTRRRIIYWAGTLGLVGPLFAAVIPLTSTTARLSVGAAVGVVVGALLGTVEARLARVAGKRT